MNQKKVDELTNNINATLTELRELKKSYPEFRTSVCNNAGSILHGFREGDIDYKEAIALLEPQRDSESVGSPKKVVVTWRDCETIDGWMEVPTVRSLTDRTRIIQTIGFDISEGKDEVIVASSHESVFGKVAGCWIIPRAQVVEIQQLSEM